MKYNCLTYCTDYISCKAWRQSGRPHPDSWYIDQIWFYNYVLTSNPNKHVLKLNVNVYYGEHENKPKNNLVNKMYQKSKVPCIFFSWRLSHSSSSYCSSWIIFLAISWQGKNNFTVCEAQTFCFIDVFDSMAYVLFSSFFPRKIL